MRLTDNKAIELLDKCIKGLYIYKHPSQYTECVDTHHVESFNNVVLVYVDKRIHFQSVMYEMRVNLATLDWNEHVGRETTSLQNYIRAKNPNAQSPKRVLKAKTFRFVGQVWQKFVQCLQQGNDQAIVPNVED